jgi:oligopeptide/dipeptide ABC transporter ATP-binding protein
VTALGKRELRQARRHMQMIFQDPYSSLNPRMTVRDIISEPLIALDRQSLGRKERDARVLDIAEKCGLTREQLRRYPHAFSGGQRQRIAIARALVLNPALVVCDEPISALDVSIQAQILNLLASLQASFGLTYLFIAHNLAAVAYVCDRVAVMYLGKIVEIGTTQSVYFTPRHPYTEALMSAVPSPIRTRRSGRSCFKASGRTRRSRPPAAASAPAAATRPSSAQTKCRRSARWRRATPRHATTPMS